MGGPDFGKDVQRGRVGHNIVVRMLQARGHKIVGVPLSVDKQGIDLGYISPTGNLYTVEVKADHKLIQTGNVFLETHSVDAATNEVRPSSIRKMLAHFFVIVCPHSEVIYWADSVDVKSVIDDPPRGSRRRSVRNTWGGNDYQMHGLIIPLGLYISGSSCKVIKVGELLGR